MPMRFTDDVLESYATQCWHYRARLANESIEQYRAYIARRHQSLDAVEAHEIRTGKPWNEWSLDETAQAINSDPSIVRKSPFFFMKQLEIAKRK